MSDTTPIEFIDSQTGFPFSIEPVHDAVEWALAKLTPASQSDQERAEAVLRERY